MTRDDRDIDYALRPIRAHFPPVPSLPVYGQALRNVDEDTIEPMATPRPLEARIHSTTVPQASFSQSSEDFRSATSNIDQETGEEIQISDRILAEFSKYRTF